MEAVYRVGDGKVVAGEQSYGALDKGRAWRDFRWRWGRTKH